MNLAKWLVINKSIRQIGGGHSRFVLPAYSASRSDIKSVLYPRLLEKDLSSGSKESQKDNPTRNRVLIETQQMPTVESRKQIEIDTKSFHEITKQNLDRPDKIGVDQKQTVCQPIFDPSRRDIGDNQMTLDEWISRDTVSEEIKDNSPVRPRVQVGRWALKRGFQKVPKPPPIQTEFKLKSVDVVRNELEYSDIEIIVKPVKGRFAGFVSDICSLISQSARKLLKKLKL